MRKQSSFDDEVTLSSAAMHLPKKCSHQTSLQTVPAAACPEANVIFFAMNREATFPAALGHCFFSAPGCTHTLFNI